MDKKIIIIAGPNGAGKSTFANEFLRQEADCPVFLNADLIATGLSPYQPDRAALRAGKLLLQEIEFNTKQENSFAFESTLSGKLYANKISKWQKNGYHVKLVYLKLATVEVAVSRVAARVAQGGHSIPVDTIHRRFTKSWHNFEHLYKPIVNSWVLYDNTYPIPLLLDTGDNVGNK